MSMVGSIAAQLQDLRIRAGNPSIRLIAQLTSKRGRRHAMARSTIQDKLGGRSPVNLSEALSIIEAFADYAISIGAPLSEQEIDSHLWRERISAQPGVKTKEELSVRALVVPESIPIAWDLHPFRMAGMDDLVHLIETSKDAPIANWLPDVIATMRQAQMTIAEMLERAARDHPRGIVQTAAALNKRFPPRISGEPWNQTVRVDGAVNAFLRNAARFYGVEAAPIIVAGLRLAEASECVNCFEVSIGSWHLPGGIYRCIENLRKAGFPNDANSVLTAVGESRKSDRILEVLVFFAEKGAVSDVVIILKGIGSGGPGNMAAVINGMEVTNYKNIDSAVQEMIRGIPYNKHSDYAQFFAAVGRQEIADRVMLARDEPPF
ncbi:hypothetical protein [Streptomyces sp. SID3343]|uniref:hypothetical protein n=1 Tax=Streptomyces sp. SID3343 TaxID=2690260 RepID=UPI001370AE49|nr:hypothetical protein [Streptomyces sp. SID3343]MYW01472.1 hypothetical protein [Streptomyces sp. SID3343]